MMRNYIFLSFLFFFGCSQIQETVEEAPKHIVFVTGDEEYRSEESMPMLASILERDGYRVSVCYALDSMGYIDPNNLHHIAGLEVLDSADLMVMFTRFRALPEEEAQYILDYAESGRPMVGFRTATHAFRYPDSSQWQWLNEEWPTKVFGQKWITHHGHFADGDHHLTEVSIARISNEHPILRGVEAFKAYSWLYHVTGGQDSLYGDSKALLDGKALRSNHANNHALDRFPLDNVVAWTKSYTGKKGQKARVFFTTLGHPFDFKEESMRKLSLNGIRWALGHEDQIPREGSDAHFVGDYKPNNSGFGQKFKPQLKPKFLGTLKR